MRSGNSNLSRLTGTPLARCTSETVMKQVQLMAEELRGKRIAASSRMASNSPSCWSPKALEQAGAKVDIVSPQTLQVKAGSTRLGRTVSVDRQLDQARADSERPAPRQRDESTSCGTIRVRWTS
jgi:hypothetical protein